MKEKELVSLVNNHLRKHKIMYGNEIRMGIGIPDVMFISNIGSEQENITDYYVLKVYDILYRKKINNIEDLFQVLQIPKKNILKYLNELEHKGAISIDSGTIQLKKQIDIKKVGTNVSIEVKVRDWKSGLNQALRYLDFSDYTYLAISDKYLKNIQEEDFIRSGVGLLSLSQDSIREVIPPVKSQICNPYFKYMSISSLISKGNNNIYENRRRLQLRSLWGRDS